MGLAGRVKQWRERLAGSGRVLFTGPRPERSKPKPVAVKPVKQTKPARPAKPEKKGPKPARPAKTRRDGVTVRQRRNPPGGSPDVALCIPQPGGGGKTVPAGRRVFFIIESCRGLTRWQSPPLCGKDLRGAIRERVRMYSAQGYAVDGRGAKWRISGNGTRFDIQAVKYGVVKEAM